MLRPQALLCGSTKKCTRSIEFDSTFDTAGIGEYKKYGPWMTNRTSMFVEYKTTDFGIID